MALRRLQGWSGLGGQSGPIASGSFYGREPFNPYLIVLQIAFLQAGFYLSLSFTYFVANELSGLQDSVLDQMFLYSKLTTETVPGWINIGCYGVVSLGPYMLALVTFIRRAKKCLDYTVTLYFIHLIVCTIYGGFPKTWVWWVMTIGMAALVTVLSEFICMKFFDLKDIAIREPNENKESEAKNKSAGTKEAAGGSAEDV